MLKTIYYVHANPDCEVCANLEGYHDDDPLPAHPHCNCTSEGILAECKKVSETVTREPAGFRYEPMGNVARGGSYSMNASATIGIAVTAAKDFLGITASGTRGEAATFTYQADVGGDTQVVSAEYQVLKVTTTTVWAVWPSGLQFTTVTTSSEEQFIRYVNSQQTPAAGGPRLPAPREGDSVDYVLSLGGSGDGGDGDEGDDMDFEMGEPAVTDAGDDSEGDAGDDN